MAVTGPQCVHIVAHEFPSPSHDPWSPTLLVEAKWSDTEVDRSLRYLKAKFPAADAWQISATGTKDYVSPEGIRVAPALSLLRTLV